MGNLHPFGLAMFSANNAYQTTGQGVVSVVMLGRVKGQAGLTCGQAAPCPGRIQLQTLWTGGILTSCLAKVIPTMVIRAGRKPSW